MRGRRGGAEDERVAARVTAAKEGEAARTDSRAIVRDTGS